MQLSIKRHYIKSNSDNAVTSHKVFKPKKAKDKHTGAFSFHEDGILSNKIFGNFNTCNCGQKTDEGICPNCNTRVLCKDKPLPDFYIPFDGIVDIPFFDIENYSPLDKKETDLIIKLFNYEGFMYDGKYVKYDLQHIQLDQFDVNKVLIGKDAILSISPALTEEWYNQQVYYNLNIPHTSLRKIILNNDTYHLGTLNTIYVEILRKRAKLLSFYKLSNYTIFDEFACKHYILSHIKKAHTQLFKILAENKRALVSSEMRGQLITGAGRGVITNDFSLDEDTVLLGKFFIKILYPSLYTQFTLEDGSIDIPNLNAYLERYNYISLLNRQPTIGDKSIMGMKPRFSEKDVDKYIIKLNPIIFDGFAGDTDGDALTNIALYSKEACYEASLLLPSRNYIEGSNGTIRNGLPEDFVYVFERLYKHKDKDAFIIHTKICEDLGIKEDEVLCYEKDKERLLKISRPTYIDIYRIIGTNMFSKCYTPNVGDFVKAFKASSNIDKTTQETAFNNIQNICQFTGNLDDVIASVNRKTAKYTNEESEKFIKSVVAANVTDITASGYFYKKLISSCDNMKIASYNDDCGSSGTEIKLPIDKDTYLYKILNRYVTEFDKYVEYTYDEFCELTKDVDSIHIRDFITCNASSDHKTFCKKCAGLYRREHDSTFTPTNIGIYTTLMITEHATQSSLDSMNNGTAESINVMLEKSINNETIYTYEDAVEVIRSIIDKIGYVGVQARFYEIALLSRLYIKNHRYYFSALVTSMSKQQDLFGNFIYAPNNSSYKKLINASNVNITSLKSKIALDKF